MTIKLFKTPIIKVMVNFYMKRIIQFLLVAIGTNFLWSCNGHSDKAEHYRYLQQFGVKFYQKINLFNRVGIGSISLDSLAQSAPYPFYGFSKAEHSLTIFTFTSNKFETNKVYYLLDSCMLSTSIERDPELRKFYIREVSIITSNLVRTYTYHIDDDNEYLNDVCFTSTDGKNRKYYNKKKEYIDYNLILSDEAVRSSNLFYGKTE